MAVTYATTTDAQISQSAATFTYDGTKELIVLPLAFRPTSGSVPASCTGVTIADGSGNTLTLKKDHESFGVILVSTTVVGQAIALFSGMPALATPSALVGGTVTVTPTFDSSVTAWGGHVMQCDMGASGSHPFGAASSVAVLDNITPWPAMPSLTAPAGSLAITHTYMNSGTMSTTSGWVEEFDSTHSGGRSQLQQRQPGVDTAIAVAPVPNGDSRGNALQAFYIEHNNARAESLSDLTLTPGDSVTLTGTLLNNANSGAALRKVGATALDALGSYTAGGASSATASVSNRCAFTPYTSEDGVTHLVEIVSTTSGAVNRGNGVRLTSHLPPSGFARTTLLTVGAPGSLSTTLPGGVDAGFGDQIEYEATKNVSGVDLTFTVNDDGTVTVSGSTTLPDAYTMRYRYWAASQGEWSGAASDFSDWATATFGEGGPEPGTFGLVVNNIVSAIVKNVVNTGY